LGYVTLYHITSAASTAAIAGASVATAGIVTVVAGTVVAAAAAAANTARRMIPHPIIEQVGQQRRRGSVALSRRRLIAALSFWEVHREEFHWLLVVVVSKCRQQAGMGARRKENKESTLSNQRCLDVCRKHKGH
jgi:hypothetical protein